LGAASLAEPQPEPAKPSDDAAVWYLTAQHMLDSVDDELIGTLTGRDDAPQDDASKASAIQQLEESLRYIRRATTLGKCSWAVDLEEDGPTALLRHLGYLRQQAKLLIDVAWFHSEQDSTRGLAIADALAVMRMSRHAAADGTVIGCLVQHNIDNMALTMLATELHKFDRKQLEHIRDQIDALPVRRSMRSAVLAERLIVDWLRRQNQQGELMSFMQMADAASGAAMKTALKGLEPEARQKQVMSWLDEIDQFYVQYADIMALPLDEFKKANEAFEKQVQASNPLVRAMMPALGAARVREAEAQVARTILKAMVAYRLGGEQAFNKVTDPIDGKPFTMEKTEDQLFVNSRLINRHGVPVRLVFLIESAEPLK
jgi:hypothetical protein